MLTNEAFNALLKTLEEPPAHALFILCTTDPQKLPATIVSRCLKMEFRRPTLENLTTKLSQIAASEKIKLSKPEQPNEFKIAEIWIKEGQLVLDASPEFWIDKLRALGVLEMCKDIVKQYNKPEPKIRLVNKGGIKNFVNNIKKRF